MPFWRLFARSNNHGAGQLLTWLRRTSASLRVRSLCLNLSITHSDKPSLIDGHITIRVSLLKDPLIFDGSPIIGQVHQSSYFVLIHGSYLGFHGFKPFVGIRARHRFFIVRRFIEAGMNSTSLVFVNMISLSFLIQSIMNETCLQYN